MSTCASCEGELRPEWKFCVWCGTPAVAVAEPDVAPAEAAETPAEAIPGAIRPEPDAPPSRATDGPSKVKAKVTFASIAPLLFSITCFAIAGLVIAWLAINVWF